MIGGDPSLAWVRQDPSERLFAEYRPCLTAIERCCLYEAQDFCLLRGSIPADPVSLQKLLSCTDQEFRSGWTEHVAAQFKPDPSNASRLVSEWALAKICEATTYRAKQSANGAKGGRRKAMPQRSPDRSSAQAALNPLNQPKESVGKADPDHSLSPDVTGAQHNTDSTNITNNTSEALPIDDLFEEIYTLHPKKRDRTLAEQVFAQVANIDRADVQQAFRAAHRAWCGSEEWEWKAGAKAPTLAEFITDQTWKYEPPDSGADTPRDRDREFWEKAEREAA
jgi:hypothetical protein